MIYELKQTRKVKFGFAYVTGFVQVTSHLKCITLVTCVQVSLCQLHVGSIATPIDV